MMASLTSLSVSPRNARNWCALKTPGLCSTELYLNSDNTECLVFERYRDSQALLDHHKNLGTQWPRFFRHALGLEKYAERLARN